MRRFKKQYPTPGDAGDPRRLAMAATDHEALYVEAIRRGAFPRVDFEAHRHPVEAVPCMTCDAKPGTFCQRPSQHKAAEYHAARASLADAVFIEQHGEAAWIERHADGSRTVHETGREESIRAEIGKSIKAAGRARDQAKVRRKPELREADIAEAERHEARINELAARLDTAPAVELTATGEQYVIEGCERDTTAPATQLNLWE